MSAYAARWHEVNADYVDEQRRTSDATCGFAAASKIFRLALQSAVLALRAWLAIYQLAPPGGDDRLIDPDLAGVGAD
ncbi:hypothetical protein [Sinorhizobium meliloti]|uniref:hypothetical protein n=1 Tax=Rhizobium meliloti TaxID=382 RepID=UPI001F20A9F7|nr:hypothetical protein [Sinorhizobium meliloti]